MKVCYFGTCVEQSRNSGIIQGLRQNGVEQGYLSFQNKFSSRVIGATVKDCLAEMINR